VRYLAGDLPGAEAAFAVASEQGRPAMRASAEYWAARVAERRGRAAEARDGMARLVELYPTSYYAGLAEEWLGHLHPRGETRVSRPPVAFPAALSGPHAERARLLAQLGHVRFARREVNALKAAGAPATQVLDAYEAIGAPGPALNLARSLDGRSADGALDRYLYPLGFWDTVEPTARAHNVDPLLVVALIRQESLFEPAAVSPADARGLMQLMPATARELSAGNPPSRAALFEPATNVSLGVRLLGDLLDRHGGSRVKALAAYNAGDQAVAKWERRYGSRETDEFVELISYRETRDYVKAVLGNYRVYHRLYAADAPPPSASARSPGSPPKAPFDMTTSTSPGRAVVTR
jgi:soluble lytic murein transglycosylase